MVGVISKLLEIRISSMFRYRDEQPTSTLTAFIQLFN